MVPATVQVGSGDTVIAVNGVDFAADALVLIGETPLTPTDETATQLTVVVPAEFFNTAGAQAVTVRNPGGATSGPATLTVEQRSQTITFGALANKTYGDANFTVSATASSGLAVSFAASGTCTVAGATVTLTGAGSCTITASQAGNAAYAPATSVPQSFAIAKGTPALTWGNPAAISYGTALSATQLNATSPVAGTFAYTPPSGTVLAVGTQTLGVTFTPTNTTDYTPVSTTRSLTVSPATPTITWATPTGITYGTALSATQLNATAAVPGTFAYTPALGAVLAAGSRTLSVTFTPTDAANYSGATTTVTLTVSKAALSVTAQAASKPYGAANPAFAVAYGGFVNGDDAGDLTGTPTFATAATASSAPGGYPVTPSGLTAANYALSFAAGTLTVNPAPLTITAQDASRAYGAANPAFTVTYSGFVLGQTSSVLGGALGCGTTAVIGSPAGTYPITCAGQSATNYVLTYQPGTLTVTAVAATVTLFAATATVGDPSVAFTATVAAPGGAVQGGTVTFTITQGATLYGSVTASPVVDGVATATFPLVGLGAGAYTVAASYSGTPTFGPASATATLTLATAQPVLTWADPVGITYGTALSATQLSATANVPGTFAYTPASGTVLGAGSHVLGVAFTPTDTANYASTTATVTLTVSKAALSVTAQAASKPYGAANPAFAVAYGGFVNGDDAGDLTGTPAFATAATASSAPGGYPVTPSGLTAANYTLSFVAGTLTVNPAPLTITADNKSKAYGAANPPLTATYDGFVLSEGVGVLGGTLSCSTSALQSSAPGGYPITCDGQTATNYALTYQPGTLTVGQGSQAITFAALANKTYGDPALTLAATASSGLAVAYAVPLNGPCTISGATLSLVGVGTCTVTASQPGDANYTAATAVVRSFTIAKGTPAITWANPAAITYGTALSATQLNATAAVPGTFAYTPALGAVLAAGSRTLSVTFTPTDAANYSGATTTVTLTVSKAALSVTAQAASKPYGAANPAFAVAYGGFVNGDDAGDLGRRRRPSRPPRPPAARPAATR